MKYVSFWNRKKRADGRAGERARVVLFKPSVGFLPCIKCNRILESQYLYWHAAFYQNELSNDVVNKFQLISIDAVAHIEGDLRNVKKREEDKETKENNVINVGHWKHKVINSFSYYLFIFCLHIRFCDNISE